MKSESTSTLSTGQARTAVAAKATKKRFVVGFLLFLGIAVNYMDRSNLSLAAPLLGRDLNLSPVQLGLIFSAFGWSYAILQIPGGMLVDRVKPRVLYAILLCGWSVATCLQAVVNGFWTLFGLRVLLGTFEAPSDPTNSRVVTTWFPERERATAIAFYPSGQYVGIAFFMPLLVYVQAPFGWRGMLFFTGAAGVVYSIVWFIFYRDPKDSKADAAELDYIRQGGGLVDVGEQGGARKAGWRQLCSGSDRHHSFHVTGVLRKRHGVDHLGVRLRTRAEEPDRPHRRNVQLHGQPVGHRGADRDRRAGQGRAFRIGIDIHRSAGAYRRAVLCVYRLQDRAHRAARMSCGK